MSHGLTERQRAIHAFCCRQVEKYGQMPSLRQLGVEFGIKSTNGVCDHLRALVRKGYMRGGIKHRERIITRDVEGRAVAYRLVPREYA